MYSLCSGPCTDDAKNHVCRRASCSLVALAPARALLLCAKHLFVAAMVCLGLRSDLAQRGRDHGAGGRTGTGVQASRLLSLMRRKSEQKLTFRRHRGYRKTSATSLPSLGLAIMAFSTANTTIGTVRKGGLMLKVCSFVPLLVAAPLRFSASCSSSHLAVSSSFIPQVLPHGDGVGIGNDLKSNRKVIPGGAELQNGITPSPDAMADRVAQ